MESSRKYSSIFLRALLCLTQVVFIFSPTCAFADFGLPVPTPYTFGPEGRAIQDLADFATPVEMISFPAHQPVEATDQTGNKLFYNTDGRLMMSVAVDGTMISYTNGGSRTYDASGKLISETKNIQGTNRSVTTNDQGTITGYTTYAFGNQVSQQFDANGNLLTTYAYTDYGKTVAYVLNELTQTKTVYNQYNQAAKDVDFQGNTVATYNYNAKQQLVSKVDVYGNVTNYDQYGRQTISVNSKGQGLIAYQYTIDDKGNDVLAQTVDLTPGITGGDITTFNNNLMVQTVSKFGGVATEYHYQGHTLIYSFDTRTNQVTWYDNNGRQSMTTLDGNVLQQQLYYKGRYVGYIDHTTDLVVMYQYEREDESVKFFSATDVPSAQDIEKYYESQGEMTDIVPTNATPVKQTGGLIHDNVIPVNQPATAPQQTVALNPTMPSNPTQSPTALNSIIQSQYHYAGGKLLSIVSQDSSDGTGWNTQVYIADMVFTVSSDMSAEAASLAQLWNTVVEGTSIATISAGSDAMAALTRSIKTLDVPGDKIPALSDAQLCNLFGWNINAVNTALCIEDVRIRAANAGVQGNITISYGYGVGQNQNSMYAASVSATNPDNFTVGGLYNNTMLDLTTAVARDSVTSPTATAGYVVSLAPNTPIAASTYSGQNNSSDYLNVNNLPKGVYTETVNNVTRSYASNGNELYEVDNNTGQTTLYDNCGRKSEVYNANNHLTESDTYADNGQLSTQLIWESNAPGETSAMAGYATKFYVGFGVANQDQATITVAGNQVNNLALVQQIFNAVSAGTSISNTDPAVATFIQTINAITISAHDLQKLNNTQLCNLLGWNMTAPDTANCLTMLSSMIQDAGFEGTLTLQYGPNTPLSVASISEQSFLDTPDKSGPPETLDLTRFTVVNPPSPAAAASGNISTSMGISLLEMLGGAIGSIVQTLM